MRVSFFYADRDGIPELTESTFAFCDCLDKHFIIFGNNLINEDKGRDGSDKKTRKKT